LHLVGYIYNWQMGFNSVFKGLMPGKVTHNIMFLSFPDNWVLLETPLDFWIVLFLQHSIFQCCW